MSHPHSLRLDGELLTPVHGEYAAARQTWKGVDRSPALIARCQSVADVQRVVGYARTESMPLAVCGTGHDVAGRSIPDGALVLSTSKFDAITIEPDRKLVTVGGGTRWGDLVAAAAQYGLATTGASVATVGVTGFSLHGGFGWLMRQCGTGTDNVMGLNLITADSTERKVDADIDPELFWAMRGAGSNFGVVTSLTLRLHEIPRVIAGIISYPATKARDLLHAYREITATAPDGLVTHFYYMGNPDRSHAVALGLCYTGTTAELDRILTPLRPLGQPVSDSVTELDLVGLQAVHDDSTPIGGRYHTRARYLDDLDDTTIDLLLDQCAAITAPLTKVFLEQLGGTLATIDPDATSFQGRDAAYSLLAVAGWTREAETPEHTAWVRQFDEAVRPLALPGGYINYLDDDEDHRIPEAYGSGYQRLVDIKRKVDPANLFRANRNISKENGDAARR